MRSPRARIALLLAALAAASAVFGGCDANGKAQSFDWKQMKFEDQEPEAPDDRVDSIPQLRGTVGEVCGIVSAGDTPIRADGVVIGLVDNGSSEIPPNLQPNLVKYLKTQIGFGNPLQEMGDVTPMNVLASLDSAIVDVVAIIPPGAPKGTRIDVQVSALPRTQTKSLVGGYLLPIELQWGRPERRSRDLKALATAGGSVFVNPFIDAEDRAQAGKLREGLVLNGGMTVRDMPIRLVLHQPDYHMAALIQRRVNERFKGSGPEIAAAQTRHSVEITIPPQWRNDYTHFLQLVMHLPRQGGSGATEAHAKRIAREMERPTADYDGLAAVWEAIGRQILPTIQELYTSEIPAIRYYAARTGLRLGDARVAGPVVLTMAEQAESVLQLDAIKELGRHRDLHAAREVLEKLLNNRGEMVRIAAYEALVELGGSPAVKRYKVGEEFHLDIVQSSGDYVIYATRTGEPRIVLFGRDMTLGRPVFFESGNDDVRIFSKKPLTDGEREGYLSRIAHAERSDVWRKINEAGERVKARRRGTPGELLEQKHLEIPHDQYEAMYVEHLCLQRRLMNGHEYSEPFLLGFGLAPLIRALGGAPRPNRETGKIDGIGLNYGQIVGVLAELCEEGDLRAKFVLQAPPALRRIYEQAPVAGRPE
jgi:hypothetical protein